MELEPNERSLIIEQMKSIIHESSIQLGRKTKQDFVRTGQEMADAHNDALRQIAELKKAMRYYKKRYYRAIAQAKKEPEEIK